VTMRLSSTVMEIWPFEVLPGRLFQEQRSVVGRSSIGWWSVGPQYYTDLIYSSSLRSRGVKITVDNAKMILIFAATVYSETRIQVPEKHG